MWASTDALRSVLNKMNRSVYSILSGALHKGSGSISIYTHTHTQWGDHSLSWNDMWEATEVASEEEVWVARMGERCMVSSFVLFGILNV